MPSFLTPKREGKASKRGGPKEDEKGKKGKKSTKGKKDSTQRELSFEAGTLQLTK